MSHSRLVEATILAEGHQSWIRAITERYSARLRLLQSKPSTRSDEVLQLFEIIVDGNLKDKLLNYLRSDPGISDFQIMNSSHGRLMGLIRSDGIISRCIADSDCFLLYASTESGASLAWRVLGAEKSFKRLLAQLRRRGIEHTVSEMSVVSSRRRLTERQEWILRIAFENGYFDDPKKIRIRALAGIVGVSAPTLHESLRRTQKKILEEHFRSTRRDIPDDLSRRSRRRGAGG
jgi:predicted DNA binding protein